MQLVISDLLVEVKLYSVSEHLPDDPDELAGAVPKGIVMSPAFRHLGIIISLEGGIVFDNVVGCIYKRISQHSGATLRHVDVLFREGEGRTAEGIAEAHTAADYLLEELRACLPDSTTGMGSAAEDLQTCPRSGKPRIGLIKLVSCLGNMYDTSLFPAQPGGFLGSTLMRDRGNLPALLSPLEVLDGAIHSLL